MLVVRAAAEHEKSQAEAENFVEKEDTINQAFCSSDGAMVSSLEHNVVHYPGTTGNNWVNATAIHAIPSIRYMLFKYAALDKSNGIRYHSTRNRLSRARAEELVYRIAAKYSNTLTFKHVSAPLDISNNAGRKHSNIK